MKTAIATIAAALAISATLGTWAMAQDELPDGPGKMELMDACATCHDTGLITAQKRTPMQWSDVIDRMTGMGASLNDAQYAVVMAYLNKNYGKADTSVPPPAAPAPAPAATPAATPAPAAPAQQ